MAGDSTPALPAQAAEPATVPAQPPIEEARTTQQTATRTTVAQDSITAMAEAEATQAQTLEAQQRATADQQPDHASVSPIAEHLQQHQGQPESTTHQEQPDDMETQHEQHAENPQQLAQSMDPPHNSQPSDPASRQPLEQLLDNQPLPQLPMKRNYEAMTTTFTYQDGFLQRIPKGSHGSHTMGFGPKQKGHFVAYTQHPQRQQDVQDIGKDGNESDTSNDSDSDNEQPPPTTSNTFQPTSTTTQPTQKPTTTTSIPPHQRLTRQEAKQLDREIPWREILKMPEAKIQKYLAAVEKEASSWLEWQSIRPLSEAEAAKVLATPALAKRVLSARGAYRDKNRGQGELKAKCRIVALGHRDPDIFQLDRSSPTPSRSTEHFMFAAMVAGYNREFANTVHEWTSWLGDASTAFLQGTQEDANRPLPLFMRPPKDGLIEKTNCWKATLYEVLGNIYGLPNAPFLWTTHVIKIIVVELNYVQHSWDKMLFVKYNDAGEPVSMVMVYVDDFIGMYRSDYNIEELQSRFTWGDLSNFKLNETKTFKGKQLCFCKNPADRTILKVTMEAFLETVEPVSIPRGRLKQPEMLTDSEKKEYRSISGCLQWLGSQARPELCAAVSLSNHGLQTTIGDMKVLQEALEFAKATPECGITFQDIPLNKETLVATYTDASWSNGPHSTSQLGVIIVITKPEAVNQPQRASVLDWRSCRSPRVCRSTLAAEAAAADEGSDRAAYLNMLISEVMYNCPAHRVGCRLSYVQITDAKSLYDCILSPNPNTSDKRSLTNIRAIQETVSPEQARWVPTGLMYADGMTKISAALRTSLCEWLQSPYVQLTETAKKAEGPNKNGGVTNLPYLTHWSFSCPGL